MTSFWKPEVCGQTMLPDRSILIGQKLMGNAKIGTLKWDNFGWFWNNVRTTTQCVFLTGSSKENCNEYISDFSFSVMGSDDEERASQDKDYISSYSKNTHNGQKYFNYFLML